MTEQEWLASDNPLPMLNYLLSQFGLSQDETALRLSFVIRTPEERKTAEGPAVKMRERKLRLFACACCRRIWDVFIDDRSRKAIEASERFADGLITQRQLVAACGAAQTVARKTGGSAGALVWAVQAAQEVAKSAQTIPTRAQLMTYLPSGIVNRVICCAEALSPPRHDEREQLAILLRDIFGNHFKAVACDSAYLTSTVTSLAQAIYAERAFDRMPILADALEDAGCTNQDILNHCRGGGGHMRGCWVVDLLLGKS